MDRLNYIAIRIGYHFWHCKNDKEAEVAGMDCAKEVVEELKELESEIMPKSEIIASQRKEIEKFKSECESFKHLLLKRELENVALIKADTSQKKVIGEAVDVLGKCNLEDELDTTLEQVIESLKKEV